MGLGGFMCGAKKDARCLFVAGQRVPPYPHCPTLLHLEALNSCLEILSEPRQSIGGPG
jgi:hypothetical protein